MLDDYRNRLALCTDPHATSLPGGESAAACQCEPGFTLQLGACTACVAGMVKPEIGNGICTPCGEGSTSLPGSVYYDECMCTAGRRSVGNACSLCEEGSYKPFTGNNSCVSCHNSMTTLGSGSLELSACVCKPGYYGVDGGAADGSGCSQCPTGTFKSTTESAVECTSCPDNSFTSTTGNVAENACQCNPGWTGVVADGCSGCPADTYKDVSGDSACQNCPALATAPIQSDQRTDCLCRPGYTGSDPDSCTACAAGSFKGSEGGAACAPCAVDTFSYEAAASCTACGPHLESEAGQGQCQCSAGYFSDNVNACEPCAAGTFKAGAGNSSALCLPCADNTYTAGGAASCSDCPAHSVSENPGDIYACLCEPGYKRTAADTCAKCPAGSAKSETGNAVSCSLCPVDTFQPTEGSATCLSCSLETGGASSTYSATGALSIEACQCAASFERTTDSCVGCSDDFYCPGQNGKVACPDPGGLAPGGSDEESDCYCEAGYFWSTESGASCEVCPQNHYCVEGTVTPVPCTASSSSDPQSVSEDACVCNVGFEPEG